MTSSERVRVSRWVNKVEEAADILLELLKTPPNPLPRQPVIDPELVDQLARITITTQDDQTEETYPMVRFLELGNGHQVQNKRNAMACMIAMHGAEKIDRNTVKFGKWGRCHLASYTHPKGAMISTPNKDDHEFGSADWHACDHVVMFRDVGDGRCMLYVSDIEPLFGLRTIGHHGVTWENVRKQAKHIEVFASMDAKESLKHQ